MKIGVIADDFTGASDIALTLAEGGMATEQYVGVPGVKAPPYITAGVVSLKSRTSDASEAVGDSLQACDWLLEQGAKQVIFKVCSTFDSTPNGNIGPVLDALANRLEVDGCLVCPAFPDNGRSVYMGHLFVNDMLLNESGMQNHPLTPMTDPDLRRVLGAQTSTDVRHLPLSLLHGDVADALEKLKEGGYVIADAISNQDLHLLGRVLAGEKLICGGSGIALGLPQNFGAKPGVPSWQAIDGAGVVLSGSCSVATRRQVENYRQQAPHLEIDAQSILAGQINPQETAKWVRAQSGSPMVFSSADPEDVARVQQRLGQQKAASAIEGFFAQLAFELVGLGVRKIVTAGGETSGAIVRGLEATRLEIGPAIAPGVPLLRQAGTYPVGLALKSGNFGAPDFFAHALERMGTDQ